MLTLQHAYLLYVISVYSSTESPLCIQKTHSAWMWAPILFKQSEYVATGVDYFIVENCCVYMCSVRMQTMTFLNNLQY